MDPHDTILVDCPNYRDYLDYYVKPTDLKYLRNQRICRQLAKLNYNAHCTVYSEEEYQKRRAKVLDLLLPLKQTVQLFSTDTSPKDPVLFHLKLREKPNNQKILSTIIFITRRKSNGFEVSSYMDYEYCLRAPKAENWKAIFEERVKLRPRRSHLSYFNTHSNTVIYNNTDNYGIIHDSEYGLTFIHKGDHKRIVVSVQNANTIETRSVVYSPIYGYVKFFDHAIRKKT